MKTITAEITLTDEKYEILKMLCAASGYEEYEYFQAALPAIMEAGIDHYPSRWAGCKQLHQKLAIR